jgi:DNA-binding response OmpR family regulator
VSLKLSVVIVEDEELLTMLLEDLLDELGCTVVATGTTVSTGAVALESERFDVAILDVNLRGEQVWPLADRLCNAGRPFILASGDDRHVLEKRYPAAAILPKPYELESLSRALQLATNDRK